MNSGPAPAARLWPLWFFVPIAACLAVYWNALGTWFFMDDYAWLQLRLEVHGMRDLLNVLFRPEAQGTVRVFSERAFFLGFSSLFGMDAIPFRICVFATQFGNIVLLGLIARELTGSRATGVLAPLVWIFNAALTVPMSWISAYNQVLWAFCLMLAFYSFVRYTGTNRRAFLTLAWASYLIGFGVLELNVLYPALILLYTLCRARAHWRKTLPFFIPAALFTIVHLLYVRTNSGTLYRMYFDGSLFRTLWQYLSWAFGPSRLGDIAGPEWRVAGFIITGCIAVALAVFTAARLRRHDLLPVFLLGWFVLTLAPTLPLKNHVSEYYLTVPAIGFAILAAWALASAWRRHWSLKIVSVILLAAYGAGMCAIIEPALEWRRDRSQRLRTLLEAVVEAHRRRPRPIVLLSGVDWDLYAAGFNDQPFRLYGLPHVYLTPGSLDELEKAPEPLRGLGDYRISPGEAFQALDGGQALVLQVQESGVRNVTSAFQTISRTQFKPAAPRHVDVGLPFSSKDLGPTWHTVENGYRWMPDRATVRMAGPRKPEERLYLKGFVPKSAVANGPVTLTVRTSGLVAGSARFELPDQQFSLDFPVPPTLLGNDTMEVELSVDRTFSPPNDSRKLGLIFAVLELK